MFYLFLTIALVNKGFFYTIVLLSIGQFRILTVGLDLAWNGG